MCVYVWPFSGKIAFCVHSGSHVVVWWIIFYIYKTHIHTVNRFNYGKMMMMMMTFFTRYIMQWPNSHAYRFVCPLSIITWWQMFHSFAGWMSEWQQNPLIILDDDDRSINKSESECNWIHYRLLTTRKEKKRLDIFFVCAKIVIDSPLMVTMASVTGQRGTIVFDKISLKRRVVSHNRLMLQLQINVVFFFFLSFCALLQIKWPIITAHLLCAHRQ